MLIKGASKQEIEHALEVANQHFDGNLTFNNFTPNGRSHRVTLRVKSSKGAGARLSAPTRVGAQRHLISACWHAHGRFFDALPEGATIRTAEQVTHPGAP